MVQTPEGTVVGPAALSLAFQSVPNLRESQIIQDSPRAITVKIAVGELFTKANEAFLVDELRKRLGTTLTIEISYVPAIPRTVSGKQRLVITSLRR
jgi:hypothetical protein